MRNLIFAVIFLRLRKTHNDLQLSVFLFSFFCQLHLGPRNFNSVFLILKILQYGRSRRWVCLFQDIHVRNDTRIDISISIRLMITKFVKQVSTEFDSDETDHVGAGDVITWQTKNISTMKVSMATKICMLTYFDGLQPTKSHDSLITWSFRITWQTRIITPELPKCLWPPNLARQ